MPLRWSQETGLGGDQWRSPPSRLLARTVESLLRGMTSRLPSSTRNRRAPNGDNTPVKRTQGPPGVCSRASHEVFRVIRRHLGRGGWLKAKRLQAFPARAVHLALKLRHVARALANLFDRNASPRENH